MNNKTCLVCSSRSRRTHNLIFKAHNISFLDLGVCKLKPSIQNTLRLQRDHKLGRRYFGPYQDWKRIGPAHYCLELPESPKIYSIFHISMLLALWINMWHLWIWVFLLQRILLSPTSRTRKSNVVNENTVDWDATQDEHMGLPYMTSRKVIPPKILGYNGWKGGSSREEG